MPIDKGLDGGNIKSENKMYKANKRPGSLKGSHESGKYRLYQTEGTDSIICFFPICHASISLDNLDTFPVFGKGTVGERIRKFLA